MQILTILTNGFVLHELQKYVDSTKMAKNKITITNMIKEIKAHKWRLSDAELLHRMDILKSNLLEYGEPSHRLNLLLNEICFQVKNKKKLLKRGDSEILDNHKGEGITIKGNAGLKQLLNYPNPNNNVAMDSIYLSDEKIDEIDFTKLSIIYVTGGESNPYGHSILRLGDSGYIQINTLYGYPQYIKNDEHFGAYLRAQGGREIDEQFLNIRYPEVAKAVFKTLAHQKWSWEMTHHNCLTFTHQIALAGGVSPWDLGYKKVANIHTEPKFPRNFSQHQNERKNQPTIINEEIKEKFYSEMLGKFDDWFEGADHVNEETKNTVAEYYATLRSQKVPKYDVLGFITSAYNLKLSASCKVERLNADATGLIETCAYNVVNDVQALLGTVHCGFFGDQRPFTRRNANPLDEEVVVDVPRKHLAGTY